jgi:hypothetical protein
MSICPWDGFDGGPIVRCNNNGCVIPKSPRFHQRGEGSGVWGTAVCRPSQTETKTHALKTAVTTRARSLTRLNCAEFRDDAWVKEPSTCFLQCCVMPIFLRQKLARLGADFESLRTKAGESGNDSQFRRKVFSVARPRLRGRTLLKSTAKGSLLTRFNRRPFF